MHGCRRRDWTGLLAHAHTVTVLHDVPSISSIKLGSRRRHNADQYDLRRALSSLSSVCAFSCDRLSCITA